MSIGPTPDHYFAEQIGVRQERFPTNAQVYGQTSVDLDRVIEEEVDDMKAGVLELARALNKLSPSSDQKIGHVIPGVAGRPGEIKAPLRPEIVDDIAARVVILSAECDVVTPLGPPRRVAELSLIADEIVSVAGIDAADRLELYKEL